MTNRVNRLDVNVDTKQAYLDLLNDYHLRSGLSLREVAVACDLDFSYVHYILDGEGLPKKPLKLIDRGVVSEKSICYDSFTAGKEKGRKSTGHAPPPIAMFFGPMRPFPVNMIASSGDASVEEMIEDVKHGVFVTRFHYTNPVDPTKAILTGLTRDGTFLIENGVISQPVMNLRYTDSMLTALKNIDMIGKELRRTGDTTTPAMKLRKLRFTGVTEY